MTVTNQKYIYEAIKSRLHLGNACYHSVQNRFSMFHLKTEILEYTEL